MSVLKCIYRTSIIRGRLALPGPGKRDPCRIRLNPGALWHKHPVRITNAERMKLQRD